MAKHKFQSAAVLPDHKRKVRSKLKHFIYFIKCSPPFLSSALALSILKSPNFILKKKKKNLNKGIKMDHTFSFKKKVT